MKKKKFQFKLSAKALLFLFVVGVIGIYIGTQDRTPDKMKQLLKLHHRELTEIVQKIKDSNVPLGSDRYYRVNTHFDPASLMRTDLLHEDGFTIDVGKIGVYHKSEKNYIITIVLEDRGSTMYGLMYSDAQVNKSNNVQWTVERATPLIFAGKMLEDHWWYAYNNLH